MSRIITSTNGESLHPADDSMIFGTPKDRLEFYRREIQYETTILANRTDAYLTAQSFLVIAFASCMANLNPKWGPLFTLVVPSMLALLGVVSTLNAWPGIHASYSTIDHWHFKQSQLLRSEPQMGHSFDEYPLFTEAEASHRGYRKSLLFSLRTPWLFLIFWIFLASYSLYIQLDPTGS